MMRVWKVYRSLSDEQKRILREKTVDLNRPAGELLALLRPLASVDATADKSRGSLGCTFALCIVLSIGSIFLWGALGPIALVPIVLIVVTMIVTGVLFFWTKNVDLSNNFREFVLPLLALLREDFDPDRPVHVRLDLRAPTDSSKKQSESAPHKSGVYYKIVDTMYVDSWMEADGVLTDGTKLSWSVTDTIRERKKTKKNPRGKHKTKTKYTKKTEIVVDVGMKRKLYDVNAPAEGELESGERRNNVHIVRRVRSDSIAPIVPRVLIDAVADVYRNARLVKKEA